MNILTGTYECKIDAKGRFKLPSGITKDLAAILAEGFVVKRSVFETCLDVYPASTWNKILAVVTKKVNPFNRKEASFLRMFSAGARKVELDSAGRVLVPKDLTGFAELSKEIVLTGTGKVFELWDKAKYEAKLNENDIGSLAQDAFGDNNIFDELS